MKRIVSLHELIDEHVAQIRQIAPDYELDITSVKSITSEQLQDAEILIGWSKKIEPEVLSHSKQLKWIQTWSAGVDRMPFDFLKDEAILLTNTSGIHAIPIAESIFGMILAFTRGIKSSIHLQSKSKWSPKEACGEAGALSELYGKTMVIAGMGEIGSQTAKIAQAFGMKVIGIRRSGEPNPHCDLMYSTDQLHTALSQGDYIVNILPLTEYTEHLFNESAFNAFKSGACFINVGRGPSVDTNALLNALKSGQIACAGLDVFEEEPLPEDHPLWQMEQVLITPHIAGSNLLYAQRAGEIFIKNLKAYIKQETLPVNLVNYEHRY